MKFLQSAISFVCLVCEIIVAVTLALLVLHLIKPLAPFVTTAVVLFFTILTFRNRLRTILSIGGIALYAASFVATSVWGYWPGMFVMFLGLLSWQIGVIYSIPVRVPLVAPKTVAVNNATGL